LFFQAVSDSFVEWALSNMLSFWKIQDTGSFFIKLHSAKVDSSRGFLEIRRNYKSPWTTNIWFRPLISQNLYFLLPKLQGFILTLLEFARPEMKITDSEWGDADFNRDRQFIGDLVVLPWTEPRVEQDFELQVHVRLYISRRDKAVPILEKSVRMELTFKKVLIAKVLSLC
jgi:hypothetical protein